MFFERQIAFIGIHIALLPKLHSIAPLLETVGSDEVIVVAKAKIEGKSPPSIIPNQPLRSSKTDEENGQNRKQARGTNDLCYDCAAILGGNGKDRNQA